MIRPYTLPNLFFIWFFIFGIRILFMGNDPTREINDAIAVGAFLMVLLLASLLEWLVDTLWTKAKTLIGGLG